MIKNKLILIIVIVSLFLAINVSADINLVEYGLEHNITGLENNLIVDYSCVTDDDCYYCPEWNFLNGKLGECYCQENSCNLIGDELIIEGDNYYLFDETEIFLGLNDPNLYEENNQSNTSTSTVDNSDLESQIAELNINVNQLNINLNQLKIDQNSLKSEVNGLKQLGLNLEQINNNLQQLNLRLNQVEENLDGEISSAIAGLAAVQIDLDVTRNELQQVEDDLASESKVTTILTYVFFILLTISVALAIIYFINRKKPKYKLNKQIASYITQKVREGKKYPQIKVALINSGWHEDEVEWAYKSTIKHNYTRYLKSSGSVVKPQRPKTEKNKFGSNKMIIIIVVSIIILLMAFFVLRGGTGQAIHFGTLEELNIEVKENIENNIEDSEFYSLLGFANLCIQVVDGDKTVSYQIIKTDLGHAVKSSDRSCDNNGNYDFAVKFLNWDSFDYLSNDLSCVNTATVNLKSQNVVILPSRYILPGFTLNQERDLSKYCDVVNHCSSYLEMLNLGC
jgi:hypothetical protein